MTEFAAILAGGQSRRMGTTDKLVQDVDGLPMLEHAVRHVLDAGVADILVCIGSREHPERLAAITQDRPDTTIEAVLDDPRTSGPVAGLLGALVARPDADVVLVLAGDMPLVGGLVPKQLLAQLRDDDHADVVVAVDPDGTHHVTCCAWRAPALRRCIEHVVAAREPGRGPSLRSVHAQAAGIAVLAVHDRTRLSDVDDDDDLARARRDVRRG